ncbi:hypothetical protein MTR67_047730, partial [Solanum verrucosum]
HTKTTTVAFLAVVTELRHSNIGDFANEENLTINWNDTFDFYYINEDVRLLATLAEAKERRRVSLVTRGCSCRSKGDEELTWSSLASIFAGEERKEGKKRDLGFRGEAASRRRGVSQEPAGRRWRRWRFLPKKENDPRGLRRCSHDKEENELELGLLGLK